MFDKILLIALLPEIVLGNEIAGFFIPELREILFYLVNADKIKKKRNWALLSGFSSSVTRRYISAMPNEVINESFVSHLGNQSNPPCGEFSSIWIALKDYYKSNLYFGIFAVLLPLNVLNSSLKMSLVLCLSYI